MNLPDELISQFAKLTAGEKETNKENTVYGTVVEFNGTKYVKLDGSDQLTPVTSTTRINNEDRVTVMIKNHTATVTGNISSPSATGAEVDTLGENIKVFDSVLADKVSTKDLAANNAEIDKLYAKKAEINELVANTAVIGELTAVNAEIQGMLKAVDAEIEDLTASNATITGKMSANEASISKLEAKDAEIEELYAKTADIEEVYAKTADIEKLYAKTADIEDLYATKASVKELDADVAKIDTLIFGSASGDVIQSTFANAVIAQLGNAQIKSAMIDSLTADKITSGSVNTNNVQVVSEDGKLLISDETIQISDDNRVRVQIGKDAAGDYSINIWDADGNLMFSEGGITDSAIKEAIIRNDMVSDNANISASKLDINSLFDEINADGTKTIKSTKVYLDEKNQTLDVAFTEMTSDMDNLDNTVSSQGTAISVIQGQISSKVWQQDIDTAKGELNTQYSALEQTVNGISATVASHTSHISNKADNSTVTAVRDRVTNIETDLSGFKSTVSNTYATKTELSDTNKELDSITGRVSKAETQIDQNTEQIALRATKTEVTETLSGYSTKEETQAAIELSANGITSSVKATYATKTELSTTNNNVANAQSDIDNLEVGGRNLLKNSNRMYECVNTSNYGSGVSGFEIVDYDLSSLIGKTLTFSYFVHCPGTRNANASDGLGGRFGMHGILEWVDAEGNKSVQYPFASYLTTSHENERVEMQTVVSPPSGYDTLSAVRISFQPHAVPAEDNTDTWKIGLPKLEIGNRATDWSPAPEDMATAKEVENAQTTADEANTKADDNKESIIAAESSIRQLVDSIEFLVTDGSGSSLMTQTENGWTFSTERIQEDINSASESLANLTNELGSTEAAVGVLQQAIADIGTKTDYIHIGYYSYKNESGEDVTEPCIELGEGENDYKLLITNTQILFQVGSAAPTRINTNGLVTENITVENELRQTNPAVDGYYVWIMDTKGYYGLLWKGADE